MGERLNSVPLPGLYAELAASGLTGRLISLALDEDLGPRREDVTSRLVASARGGRAAGPMRVVARESGRVCGLAAAAEACAVFGGVTLSAWKADGEAVASGEAVAELSGEPERVTTLERTLLNLIGRLSGVATLTARFVAAASGRARVCDTRKTTPGLRVLEKYAVRCGGGWLHRLGLHDAVLVKDNHLAGLDAESVGRLAAAVVEAAARLRDASAAFARDGFVEIEVDGLDQLAAVLRHAPGVDAVLLDNMPAERLRKAVAMRDASGSACELEASGGVRLETIGSIAATGVDRVSVGAITHGAAWLDVGLDVG